MSSPSKKSRQRATKKAAPVGTKRPESSVAKNDNFISSVVASALDPSPLMAADAQRYQQAQSALRAQDYAHAYDLLAPLVTRAAPRAEWLHVFALAEFYCGQRAASIARLEALLQHYPQWADVYYNLGTLLQQMAQQSLVATDAERDAQGALNAFARAYELGSRREDLCVNYALQLAQQKQFEAAEVILHGLLARTPENTPQASTSVASIYNDLSYLYFQWCQPSALLYGQQAIARAPQNPLAWINLGNAWVQAKQTEAALDAFTQAQQRCSPPLASLAVNAAPPAAMLPHSQLAIAQFNRALAYLALADETKGWPLYEWRWLALKPSPQRTDLKAQEWRGEPVNNSAILLIYCEQGLGDSVQFLRYVSVVARYWRGPIWLELQTECVRMAEQLWLARACVTRIVARGTPLSGMAYQCPLMSLPFILQQLGDTTLPSTAYLRAPATPQNDVTPLIRRPRLALAWAGSPTHSRDALRSVPLAQIAQALFPLSSEIDFISLQKQPRTNEQVPTWLQVSPIEFNDLYDTALALVECDALICVDTALAHLAGAMGKVVYLLLPFAADWRWRDPDCSPAWRDCSAWYPRVRLLRATQMGIWSPVMTALVQQLRHDWLLAKPNLEGDIRYRYAYRALANNDLTQALTLLQSGLRDPELAQRAPWQHLHGNLQCALQHFPQAQQALLQATSLAPENISYWRDLAKVQMNLRSYEAAQHSWQQVLRFGGQAFDDRLGIAEASFFIKEFSVALSHYQQLLSHPEWQQQSKQRQAQNLHNCGACLAYVDPHGEAIQYYQQALALKPDYPLAQFNLALTQLQRANWAQGWPLYEARLQLAGPPLMVTAPEWRGDFSLHDQCLIIEAEQGLGDVVMALRYVPKLLDQVSQLVLLLPKAILELPQWLGLNAQQIYDRQGNKRLHVFYDANAAQALPITCRCPILSLPYAFFQAGWEPAEDRFYGQPPYLFAPQAPSLLPEGERAADLRVDASLKSSVTHRTAPQSVASAQVMQSKLAGTTIALVWRGNPANQNDRLRSIPLEHWQPLVQQLQTQGVRLVSPNLNPSAAELQLMQAWGIVDCAAHISTVVDAARVLADCQRVISVDTLHLHVAGALGIKADGLIPYFPDFRWQLKGNDCPWYRSVRLWRQPTAGDWHTPLNQLIAHLTADLRHRP